MSTSAKPAFYIREKIEVYKNDGNPTHPYNGKKILTVSVMEKNQWFDDEDSDNVVDNFGGMFEQDDAAVRSEAAEYLKSQAASDAEYYDRYIAFTAKMDATEWEY